MAADGYAFKEDSITAKTVNGDALITEKDENGFIYLLQTPWSSFRANLRKAGA